MPEAKYFRCKSCRGFFPIQEKESHACLVPSPESVMSELTETQFEIWEQFKLLVQEFSDYYCYASKRSVMFSRRVCFCFLRPRSKDIEIFFFLGRELDSSIINKVEKRSETKFAHRVILKHSERLEEPLTSWLHEAYEFAV